MKFESFMQYAGAILLILLSSAGVAASGGEQMDRFFTGLETFSAAFNQVVRNTDGEIQQQAQGRVVIQRPGRFRWDYEQPYRQLLVGDGRNLWTYDEDLQQATVKSLDEVLAGTPALLLSQARPPRELFDVTDLGQRDGQVWVELKPHDQEIQFQQVRLAFHDNLLVAMELVDSFEQQTEIRFSAVERNRTVVQDLFQFTPPAGVDLIGEPRS